MKSKIGIVGGSGYIGSSIARYLLNNFDVRILDVVPPPRDLEGKVEYVFCDIRKREDVEKGLNDLDFVIHTAIIQIPLINEQKRLGYEVNIIGTQNVCETVEKTPSIKGMILASSWHTMGEKELNGVIDEEFGYRPDKVEERAKLYAISKIAQECIVRFYAEMSNKIFVIVRMGTVLGENMPKGTAASIFIERGLRGESITPFKHSMYRPMLYVDINDVCRVYERIILKIIDGELTKSTIFNVYYPEPITILELAEIIRDTIIKLTNGRIKPNIEIIDQGKPLLFTKDDKDKIKVNITKLLSFLSIGKLISPRESIERIVKGKLSTQ